MLPLTQLWLPIVLASIIVFVASSLLHMVLTYHNVDYKALANEDEVRALLRASAPTPGQYMLPYCADMKAMGSPATLRKLEEGPNGLLFLRAPGVVKLGPQLGQWFVYTLAVSLFSAYVGVHTIAPGTTYLEVFRVVGTVAFLGYAGSHVQASIWKAQPWPVTFKDIADGLVYGLLTGGTFGWLWPKG